jgi:cytochrome c biogenesis protein CcdA
VAAALFFGSLIPLAVAQESRIVLPVLYGLGTGLPVVAVAALIAGGESALGKALHKIDSVQRWAQRVTGGVLIAVGVYFSVRFIFLS